MVWQKSFPRIWNYIVIKTGIAALFFTICVFVETLAVGRILSDKLFVWNQKDSYMYFLANKTVDSIDYGMIFLTYAAECFFAILFPYERKAGGVMGKLIHCLRGNMYLSRYRSKNLWWLSKCLWCAIQSFCVYLDSRICYTSCVEPVSCAVSDVSVSCGWICCIYRSNYSFGILC